MKPLVSVVVLTYNQEQYISKTLDSIISQQRDFSIEILINDDCSTDKTAEIVRYYQQQHPDIIKAYLQPVNMGAMKSYYFMLKKCRGKYMMNVAGDDYWLPGKIKQQIEYMENNPNVGMCFGRSKILKNESFVGHWGTKGGENFRTLLSGNVVSALTVCVRKSLLAKYIETVQPEQRDWKMEDYPMALWFSKYSKIHYINKDLGVYRILSGSLAHPKTESEKLAFAESCRDICLYFAGDDKEYIDIVNKAYERMWANVYLELGDLKKFRSHNLKGGMRGIVKNIISYMPGGNYFLKKLIFH